MLWAGGVGTRPGTAHEPFSWPYLQSSLAIFVWALSGVLLLERRATTRLGSLMLAVAGLLAVSRLVDSSVPLLFTMGLVLQWLTLPLQLTAMLGYPSGRLAVRSDRVVVGVLAGAAVLHGPIAGLMYEPVEHWVWCTECQAGMNLLLVDPVPAFVDTTYLILLTTIVATAAYGAVLVGYRWVRSNAVARRVRGPMLIPAVGYLAIVVFFHLYALATELGWFVPVLPLEQVGLLGWFALVALPVTFLFGLVRARARRGRVADMVSELHADPTFDRLEGSLRRTLGDPSLEVTLLSEGEPAPVVAGKATTTIEGDDGALAVLVHDVALLEDVRLLDATVAATKLVLENGRLAAELEQQLREVQASRARIVRAGDDARRRVERDLHDGAQQQLVALSFILRQAKSETNGAAPLLDKAIQELDGAMQDLRDLARGVFPLALVEGGIAAALDGLADRSPLPLVIEELPASRLPEAVEAGVYFVISESVTNAAKYADATIVSVSVREEGDVVIVDVSDDGAGGASFSRGGGLEGLRDRVQALDGTLSIRSPAGGGTVVHAEVPCGSS